MQKIAGTLGESSRTATTFFGVRGGIASHRDALPAGQTIAVSEVGRVEEADRGCKVTIGRRAAPTLAGSSRDLSRSLTG